MILVFNYYHILSIFLPLLHATAALPCAKVIFFNVAKGGLSSHDTQVAFLVVENPSLSLKIYSDVTPNSSALFPSSYISIPKCQCLVVKGRHFFIFWMQRQAMLTGTRLRVVFAASGSYYLATCRWSHFTQRLRYSTYIPLCH